MKWFSPNSVKLAGFSSLSFYLIYVICMSNHCSKQLDYERPKLVTRPWILDRQLNYFPFKNENHFYVRKERERDYNTTTTLRQKKKPPKITGYTNQKSDMFDQKNTYYYMIWYSEAKIWAARWILIGSYIDIEILEVLFFLSIETSLQIK